MPAGGHDRPFPLASCAHRADISSFCRTQIAQGWGQKTSRTAKQPADRVLLIPGEPSRGVYLHAPHPGLLGKGRLLLVGPLCHQGLPAVGPAGCPADVVHRSVCGCSSRHPAEDIHSQLHTAMSRVLGPGLMDHKYHPASGGVTLDSLGVSHSPRLSARVALPGLCPPARIHAALMLQSLLCNLFRNMQPRCGWTRHPTPGPVHVRPNTVRQKSGARLLVSGELGRLLDPGARMRFPTGIVRVTVCAFGALNAGYHPHLCSRLQNPTRLAHRVSLSPAPRCFHTR